MARRKRKEEGENHERWLVSYADFITLLFAFFTSMYAISSVNEGKYRVLSESLSLAFNPTASTVQAPKEGPHFVKQESESISDEFRAMFTGDYKKVRAGLKQLEEEKKLELFYDGDKITIRVLEGVLFAPGSAELIDSGKGALVEVAKALKSVGGNVTVEGHTDNIPIHTERFPTNWDLSGARAINILKYFVEEEKMPPRRLGAAGFGEFRPVASNDTPGGRARNRRIDILVDTSGL